MRDPSSVLPSVRNARCLELIADDPSFTNVGVAYMCLGGFVVAFSMFSLLARDKLYINEVVLGTAFGILMGPHFAGVFNPRSWGSHSNAITLEAMRVILAIGLFAIGVELPKTYMAKHAKSLLVMIIPTMAIGWFIVAGLIHLLFPQFNFVSCLAIAACLTPTDPIISAAINVPMRLRHLLSAESAANDGLAYPFLTIAIYLTVDATKREAIGHWVLVGCLYQVVLGVFVGVLLGLAFSSLMEFSHRHGLIDRQSYVTQYLSLAIFVSGIVSTLGSDDLLAVFAAGCAISWDGEFTVYTEGQLFSSVIDFVLNCVGFIYIGAWLPFESFTIPALDITPGRLLLLTMGVLLLRRIPPMLMLYKWIPEITSWRQALFSGHFGPMGVGAVYTSTLAIQKLTTPQNPPITQEDMLTTALHPIVSFVVLNSIVVHGLSIPLFSAWCNIRTLSLSRTLSSMTTSDWFYKNTAQNEANEDQMSFHVTVDFELQSPKESGPKTATAPSTATPEVDVDFQEGKNQTELENVRLATTPTDNQDTETSNIAGPPGTPVPAFQVRPLAGHGQ
ncbi:uncharacterized protein LACBIDRAFT_302195 [Laccaria bicolor S238N-H82]|uniref:Predicted protein n=1 Tax=Laccaria bicolor (strain S238N-H82 / ATCC MYA-4686) TaxID=486041 RepID=B0DH98_LACBS|nr:uncharacterized protein LACBIDRAFT_302195 [Laccaria bicolor S238N-H82]EDR06073.1 predicted protein [Laccaria bicolor S238N-H82]|eukprot:XP_001883361.1 predicted protein [Laccaria bicolor S238N-H82]